MVEGLLLARRARLKLKADASDGRSAALETSAQQAQRVCGRAALDQAERKQRQRRRGGATEDGLVPRRPLRRAQALGEALAAGERALCAQAEAVRACRLEGGDLG